MLQKANEKLNTQEVPKTKGDNTDMTPTAALWSPFPEYSHSNSLSELPFHSEETIKRLPFKIRPPETAGNPLQVSFTPRSKTILRAIVKEFSKPRGESPKVF